MRTAASGHGHRPAIGDPPKRVYVIGTSASGKTVFAEELARRLGLEHIELDAMYWGPRWVPADRAAFLARARAASAGEAWVIDGSHRIALPYIWKRADLVVWLDYRLSIIIWRMLRRTVRRLVLREPLWHGNTERFARVFGRRSPLAWAVRTEHWWLKRIVPDWDAESDARHLVRLRSPREAAVWLATAVQSDADRA